MHFFRKVLLFLAGCGLTVSLYALASSTSVARTVGEPAQVKSWLQEGEVYGNIVEAFTNQLAKAPAEKQAEGLSVSDPKVKQIFADAFPPPYLQKNVESFVDGLYRWLNGKVDQPDFLIDLSVGKANLADGLARYGKERVAGLPPCTSVPENQDPFSITCRPPGRNIDAEIDGEVSKFKSEDNFLGDGVITTEDLVKDGEKSAFTKDAPARKVFQLMKLSPILFAILTLISAVAVLFLSLTRRDGLRRIAHALSGAGIFLIVSALIVGYIINNTKLSLPGQNASDTATIQNLLLPVVKAMVNAVNKVGIIFGAGYILTALAIRLGLHFTKPKIATKAAPK